MTSVRLWYLIHVLSGEITWLRSHRLARTDIERHAVALGEADKVNNQMRRTAGVYMTASDFCGLFHRDATRSDAHSAMTKPRGDDSLDRVRLFDSDRELGPVPGRSFRMRPLITAFDYEMIK